MQSGYDINQLIQEAKTRWLKPPEVFFILQNHESIQISQLAPQKPPSGSLFKFNKKVLKFFRKDGYNWRKKKDGRTVGEAHERLKVGSAEALNCYYAHGAENPSFQRRSYWMLDPKHEHIVLVHYRDTMERVSSGSTAGCSPGSSSSCTRTHSTYSVPIPGSGSLSGFPESCQKQLSQISLEVSSDAGVGKGVDSYNDPNGVGNLTSSDVDFSHALRRLKEQLSLDDDVVEEYEPDEQDVKDDGCGAPDVSYNSNGPSLLQDPAEGLKDHWISTYISQNYGTSSEMSKKVLYPSLGMADAVSSLTVAIEQRFTIRETSPEWGFSNDHTKVIIVGSFLCNPSDCVWYCMFGNVEVPLDIIQNGVFCCQAPPHPPGKVTFCITSGNRESCSEIREFEYRNKHSTCACDSKPEGGNTSSTEELLLLVRFAQMLLSNSSRENDEVVNDLSLKQNGDDDSWSQIIGALLVGGGTLFGTLDWLLQKLLEDKLRQWFSSKGEDTECSLSKKEQGIIHMIAGLGYIWALNPILEHGVGVNFRDINGWTALHWAARFGREKMVAALIASGASAVAVTDPNSRDHIGRTPAHIAAAYGYKGLAGYLSEVALTSHLSSLTLEESELLKGSAHLQAELAVNYVSESSVKSNKDQLPLKQTLAAVRNAAQAAARIQAAFRAHSFRKRQRRLAENSAALSRLDGFVLTPIDIQGLSAASKLSFRKLHEHNKAALSIQKNFRSWKDRKDFLTMRQKVVRIQAHVRGYQVRKKYRVICWAVGILDKAVLRWRRKGAGLRGFKTDSEFVDESDEDEDIIREFRKEKVSSGIEEAVSRVLSMVDSSEAREQYHRVFEKYCVAKAELQGSSTLPTRISDMDDDDFFKFP